MTRSQPPSSHVSDTGGPLWANARKIIGLPPDLKQGLHFSSGGQVTSISHHSLLCVAETLFQSRVFMSSGTHFFNLGLIYRLKAPLREINRTHYSQSAKYLCLRPLYSHCWPQRTYYIDIHMVLRNERVLIGHLGGGTSSPWRLQVTRMVVE